MGKKSEARKFSRSPVSVRLQVRLDNGILIEGETRDVSFTGLWFQTDRSLPLDSTVRILIEYAPGSERIDTRGKVVRVDEGGVAIEFIDPREESEEHLQRLVLDNAENETSVLEEFKRHFGAKPPGE